MGGIFDILKSIGEFFASCINFVITILSDLIYMVKIMAMTIGKVPQFVGFLPSVVTSLFLVALGIIVVYKVVGRD